MAISEEKLSQDKDVPKNGYFVYLLLTAVVALFFIVMGGKNSELKAKDVVIGDQKLQIQKLETKLDRVDSINHNLYELLGAKKIVDSLRRQ